jgi:hypothetical protein
MPVKRRSAKRRLTPEAELAAWQDTFENRLRLFRRRQRRNGPCRAGKRLAARCAGRGRGGMVCGCS